MSEILYTKDVFTTPNFIVRFNALVEYTALDEVMDYEEGELQQLSESINSYNTAYFCAKVSLWSNGIELSSDYLGCCIYDEYEDFVVKYKHDYFSDMLHTVIKEGREEMKELKKTFNNIKIK